MKKKSEETTFSRKKFLKSIGKSFAIYLKKNYYCYNIIQMHIILHIYQPIETIVDYNRNHGRFYET